MKKKKKRRKNISPAPAIRATHKNGRSVGLQTGGLDGHGELKLLLDVDGHRGSLWLSREIWEAIGEKVGWREKPAPTLLIPPPPRRISYEREAEELRAGIEGLMTGSELVRDMVALDADELAVRNSDLQYLLDRVDARDSLAFLEKKDRRAKKTESSRTRRSRGRGRK